MKLIETEIADVKIIEPRVFGDDRGFFMETWNEEVFHNLGLDLRFVQDNHSCSSKNILRGLHYQVQRPQGKLVRVISGAVYDVAVDLRQSSQTFGKWVGVEISAANKRMLWVPPGFAHGFLALEDNTHFLYKCTDFYLPSLERCVLWNDSSLEIDWPISAGSNAILSDKDRQGSLLATAEVFS
jgi:dTDP-4-dehydrorhamnose 3,5-epimerase